MKTHFKKNGGFTLVELIVVIAILAILAAVAIPAYSGYITKANTASDDQLLAAINRAAAAAVLEVQGVDMASLDDNELICAVSPLSVSGKIAGFKEAFDRYFAGNEDAAFKAYKSVLFVNGAFVGDVERRVLAGKIDISSVADIFKASNYYDGEDPEGSISALTGTVDKLSTLLAEANGGLLINKLNSENMEAFQATLTALGIDPATATNQELSNAAVFFVANNLQGLKADDLQQAMLNQHMGDGNSEFDTLLNNYFASQDVTLTATEQTLVKTSLQYGIMQSFVNSLDPQTTMVIDGKEENVQSWFANQNPQSAGQAANIIATLTGKDGGDSAIDMDIAYALYLEECGKSDINAFVNTMGAVDANKDSFGSLSGKDVFSNQDVQDALLENLVS